LHGRHTK